jgi:DNA-binding MarR family transcriptional regulator
MKKDRFVSDVREFSRFYTNIIGLLNGHLLNSPYTLPEARVLYEIAQQQETTAKALIETLTIDKGYLSRILKIFEKKGIIQKEKHGTDARAALLVLTKKGQADFKTLNLASEKQVGQLLNNIPPQYQKKLVANMNTIRSIITKYSGI